MSMRKGPPMAPGRSGQRPDSEYCEPEVAAVCSSELRGGTVMVDRQEEGALEGEVQVMIRALKGFEQVRKLARVHIILGRDIGHESDAAAATH